MTTLSSKKKMTTLPVTFSPGCGAPESCDLTHNITNPQPRPLAASEDITPTKVEGATTLSESGLLYSIHIKIVGLCYFLKDGKTDQAVLNASLQL
jgi:hypothetical protein